MAHVSLLTQPGPAAAGRVVEVGALEAGLNLTKGLKKFSKLAYIATSKMRELLKAPYYHRNSSVGIHLGIPFWQA